MAAVDPSSDSFQQDNTPCHKACIISRWLREHDNEFSVLQWPPQSPDLNLMGPLGCARMGDSQHESAANKSAATVWCYRVNMNQNLRNVSSTWYGINATRKSGCSGGKTRYYSLPKGVLNKVVHGYMGGYANTGTFCVFFMKKVFFFIQYVKTKIVLDSFQLFSTMNFQSLLD